MREIEIANAGIIKIIDVVIVAEVVITTNGETKVKVNYFNHIFITI